MSIVAGKVKYERGLRLIDFTGVDLEAEIEDNLKYIRGEKEGNQRACMRFLASYHGRMASKNLLIDKNIKMHRLNCYIAAKLKILSSYRKDQTFGNSSQLFDIFMSNNQDLISFLKNNLDEIIPDDYENEKKTYRTLKNTYGLRFLLRVTLYALKGNWGEVKRRCNAYLEKPLTDPKEKYREYDYQFFKSLADRDIAGMKVAINEMMNPKVAKKILYDTSTFYDFYLHVYVIMYAKIALYHGFDLEIDNEVAPKELIDNTPLNEYEDPYKFMKEFDLATITSEGWKNWIYRWSQ